MSKVNLETFAGGALQEKVDRAMDEVLQNMQDPNTPWKNKRGITIKISFQQNEDRDDTAVDVVVEKKLAHSSPIVTRMSIGTDCYLIVNCLWFQCVPACGYIDTDSSFLL